MWRESTLGLLMLYLAGCSRGYGVAVIVRHAEKQGGPGNVSLTEGGQRRARDLVDVIRGPITAVYATDFCRTIQTAEPVALAAGVPIHVQTAESGGHASCEPAIRAAVEMLPASVDSPRKLAAHVKQRANDGTILIVGHSNTVDELVTGVGGGAVQGLSEGKYDRLFLVTSRAGQDAGRLFVVRYGEPNP